MTEWLAGIAAWLPFGYAFGAGMLAAVNPCGFAILPAYLALYLRTEGDSYGERAALARLAHAVVIGAAVTSGFVVLFGITGVLVSLGGVFLVEAVPWLAVALGAAMVGLGFWLLQGGSLSLALAFRVEERLISGLDEPRGAGLLGPARAFFIFGVAYAVASLSCTLPIFLLVVGSALAAGGLLNGAVQFLSYALGMGLVILLLTVSAALFKGALAKALRQLFPYFQKVSAVLLIGAGTYLLYYWLVGGGLLSQLSG